MPDSFLYRPLSPQQFDAKHGRYLLVDIKGSCGGLEQAFGQQVKRYFLCMGVEEPGMEG